MCFWGAVNYVQMRSDTDAVVRNEIAAVREKRRMLTEVEGSSQAG